VEELEITRYQADGPGAALDWVVDEARVGIWVNGTEVGGLMALPQELEELALGFLFGECYFDAPSEVSSVSVNPRLHAVSVSLDGPAHPEPPEVVRTMTTGCGRSISRVSPLWTNRFPRVESTASHPAGEIQEAVRRVVRSSDMFRQTGCVHSAGIWSEGDFLWTCDDVGRHNAADKAIGHALRRRWPLGDDAMLVCTGRLSSDIVLKTIRARIPVLVSRSAPTGGAVQIAREHGITLVGFARSDRCNVYTRPDRIQPS